MTDEPPVVQSAQDWSDGPARNPDPIGDLRLLSGPIVVTCQKPDHPLGVGRLLERFGLFLLEALDVIDCVWIDRQTSGSG